MMLVTIFSMGYLIYVTHITPLEAVSLFQILVLCSLGIQPDEYMSNEIVKCFLSVAQAFILLFFLICYSTICNKLLWANYMGV